METKLFTPRPPYSQGKSRRCRLNRKLGASQSQLERFGQKEEPLTHSGYEPRFLGTLARSLVTMPTNTFCVYYYRKYAYNEEFRHRFNIRNIIVIIDRYLRRWWKNALMTNLNPTADRVLYRILVGFRRLMPPDALQLKAYCTNPSL